MQRCVGDDKMAVSKASLVLRLALLKISCEFQETHNNRTGKESEPYIIKAPGHSKASSFKKKASENIETSDYVMEKRQAREVIL